MVDRGFGAAPLRIINGCLKTAERNPARWSNHTILGQMPLKTLFVWGGCQMNRSLVRSVMPDACFLALFTLTKRMVGHDAVSAIAGASFASFF